jgi:hypothetical protein
MFTKHILKHVLGLYCDQQQHACRVDIIASINVASLVVRIYGGVIQAVAFGS